MLPSAPQTTPQPAPPYSAEATADYAQQYTQSYSQVSTQLHSHRSTPAHAVNVGHITVPFLPAFLELSSYLQPAVTCAEMSTQRPLMAHMGMTMPGCRLGA